MEIYSLLNNTLAGEYCHDPKRIYISCHPDRK